MEPRILFHLVTDLVILSLSSSASCFLAHGSKGLRTDTPEDFHNAFAKTHILPLRPDHATAPSHLSVQPLPLSQPESDHRKVPHRTDKEGKKGRREHRLPKALIIGVKKGGTRALLEFLRVHPDVRAPGKEVHYFDRHYHRGLDWYRSQMPLTSQHQMTIEKTPSYFITVESPARVYNTSRDMKLIIVVRDPVTRAISDYTQSASKRAFKPPFPLLAFRNATGEVRAKWSALRIGMYARHLERWLRYFDLNNMLFVSGERMISDPAAEMNRVQDFLGLRRFINENHFYYNSTKGFPCIQNVQSRRGPHCLGRSKGRAHPKIEPELLEKLRTFFRPLNQKFYQMVGQDFGWELNSRPD